MRKITLLLGIVFAFAVVSCSKDSSSEPDKLSATIGGKSWKSAVRVTNLASNVFVITGTSLTGEILTITIKGDAEKIYQLNLTNYECAATYKASATASTSDVYESYTGKVTLTKVDKANKTISGTFEFTLTKLSLEQLEVTNGTFNGLEYIEANN